MTKSTKTDTQAVQILGAALALGMSLGMLPSTAASAEEMKHQQTDKLEGASTAKHQQTDKLEGASTAKHQQTDKLEGASTAKHQQTDKLEGTSTIKLNNQNTRKPPGSPKPNG
jgi:hypothetical protein